MRILFLDDMQDRHDRFRSANISRNVTYVYTYEDAIKALQGDRFDEIWLDHDLGSVKTGYDVAVAITQLPLDKYPSYVYIHSFNDAGARRMGMALTAVGIRCARQFV